MPRFMGSISGRGRLFLLLLLFHRKPPLLPLVICVKWEAGDEEQHRTWKEKKKNIQRSSARLRIRINQRGEKRKSNHFPVTTTA